MAVEILRIALDSIKSAAVAPVAQQLGQAPSGLRSCRLPTCSLNIRSSRNVAIS